MPVVALGALAGGALAGGAGVTVGMGALAGAAVGAGAMALSDSGGGGSSETAPRDLNQETTGTLQNQVALAPDQYAAYQKYAPLYAQTDVSTIGKSLFGPDYTGTLADINARLTTEAAAQSATANSAQRQADLADVAKYGSQAQQTYQDANKGLFGARDQLAASAAGGIPQTDAYGKMLGIANTGYTPANATGLRDVTAQTGNAGLDYATRSLGINGPSQIQRTLESQAQEGLNLGGSLSGQEIRDSQQAARAGWGARGLVNSNGALAQEILDRDSASRQRMLERQALAAQVDATGFSQRQQNVTNALGVSNAALGYANLDANAQQANQQADVNRNQLALQYLNRNDTAAQNQFNQFGSLNQAELDRIAQQNALSQQSFQNFAGTAYDPYQGVLGRSSVNQGTNQGLFGDASGVTTGSNANVYNQFNPYNSYASDLYNTNMNAQYSTNAANATNSSNQKGAMIGAAATIGVAAIAL